MFRNIGSFWCFTNMCVSQISWATALWGWRYCGTCAPSVGSGHICMQVRDTQAYPPVLLQPMRLACLACRRGASGRTSNEGAREGEPATFPKHAAPCVPEPP